MKYFLLGFLITWSNAAHAEEPKTVYKKKTEIEFDSLELEGELVKPQGALVLERKRASFNPLIKLRKDFNIEMNQSTKHIK
tara:strand:+ start:2032 stop:2274 length:243 start_codon:yes stop_codon:yes gene_type:complete